MSRKPPPFHTTGDDVEPFVEEERLDVDYIVAHQFVRESGGRIAVFCEPQFIELTNSSWSVRQISVSSGRLSCVTEEERQTKEVTPGTVAMRRVDRAPWRESFKGIVESVS